ncbi:uncharacterized protein BYT42DRAFT_605844 [Radiomyces spectabilis]|uniref:uncharacterized protein n=1 Tax=Radiomyces spectabilis TaxID=64574 RepID=UPI00221FA3C1|nr:uncharacterized protein BYT42DRAFT_605844 [Radiomyces spectabilis]KAI8376217.1 hypothetical protein BYT42DRAFT_605844 [Radiomyces spectabilis]
MAIPPSLSPPSSSSSNDHLTFIPAVPKHALQRPSFPVNSIPSVYIPVHVDPAKRYAESVLRIDLSEIYQEHLDAKCSYAFCRDSKRPAVSELPTSLCPRCRVSHQPARSWLKTWIHQSSDRLQKALCHRDTSMPLSSKHDLHPVTKNSNEEIDPPDDSLAGDHVQDLASNQTSATVAPMLTPGTPGATSYFPPVSPPNEVPKPSPRRWMTAVLMISVGTLIALTFIMIGLGKALSGNNQPVSTQQSFNSTPAVNFLIPHSAEAPDPQTAVLHP